MPMEEIARLAGHNRTATTELVYRHELRPVITTGAEVMDRILSRGNPRKQPGQLPLSRISSTGPKLSTSVKVAG